MKEMLINLLKPIAVMFYNMVVAVPLPMVRLFFLGMLAVMAIWLFTLPAQRDTDKDGKPKSWITDLRVMGLCLLVLQSLCYIFL